MVRKATSKDIEEILSLNDKLFKYESQFGNMYNLDWTYSDRGKEYFQKRLTEKSGLVFIAEEKDNIVGYLCGYIDTYSYRSVNPIAEIENMFVLEDFRGRGIGSNLIRSFEVECRKREVTRFRVGFIFQNKKAERFYTKFGFDEFEKYLEKAS